MSLVLFPISIFLIPIIQNSWNVAKLAPTIRKEGINEPLLPIISKKLLSMEVSIYRRFIKPPLRERWVRAVLKSGYRVITYAYHHVCVSCLVLVVNSTCFYPMTLMKLKGGGSG